MTENTNPGMLPGESEFVYEERRRQAEIMRQSLYPLNSLVASAKRLTKTMLKERTGFGKPEAWQDDAWDMFDLVGEQRFLATTLAGRMSQARFYVGKLSDDPLEPPEPLDTDESLPARVFDFFGDSPTARSQMVQRMAVNLFVAGDGYLAGIPRWMLPDSEEEPPEDTDAMLSLEDLEWRMLSVSEVIRQQENVVLRLGEAQTEQLVVDPDQVFLIRVWRPHPRRYWQADSPTRATLPVLRELVGLTMHISAQVDSRLAGAGVFIVPQSARRALAVAAGVDPDTEDDPFTDALMEAMMTAIQDRSSAAALVPLVITVPDESTGLFQHITFANALDGEARELRDEAIRRLALGQDAPPELLLGVGGMNHWGAWLVREDVVTTHIEPPLALICDAITTQFLVPVLIEQGMDEEEARNYVVWYDVSHLVQRPNRLSDAQVLHEKGVISDEALREAGGFGDADSPKNLSRPVEIAVELAQRNPALIDNMAEIVKAFEEILTPGSQDVAVAQADDLEEDVTEEDTDAPDSTEATPDTTDGGGPTDSMPDAEPDFTVEQIMEAFASVPHGKEFLAGLLGKGLTVDIARPFDTVVFNGEYGQTQTFAPEHVDTSKSVAIVALPKGADALPGPEEKHATLLYLGHFGESGDGAPGLSDAKEILLGTVAEVARSYDPFTAQVSGLDNLGDDGAVVWFLSKDSSLPDVRESLFDLGPVEIRRLVDEGTFTKYDEFLPHVTLGYPDQGLTDDALDEATQLQVLEFDSLALWWGEERHVFPLGTVGVAQQVEEEK